jgi:hypothetical protein
MKPVTQKNEGVWTVMTILVVLAIIVLLFTRGAGTPRPPVVVAPSEPSTPMPYTFADSKKVFSLSYTDVAPVVAPSAEKTAAWTVNNDDQTEGTLLAMAEIDRSTQPQTNFGGAKFTVGMSADTKAVAKCLLPSAIGAPVSMVTIGKTQFAKTVGTDVGAGNYYTTTAYRTVHGGACYSVEYTVHSTNLGSYDPSQGISAFDQAKLDAVLVPLAQSFTFL